MLDLKVADGCSTSVMICIIEVAFHCKLCNTKGAHATVRTSVYLIQWLAELQKVQQSGLCKLDGECGHINAGFAVISSVDAVVCKTHCLFDAAVQFLEYACCSAMRPHITVTSKVLAYGADCVSLWPLCQFRRIRSLTWICQVDIIFPVRVCAFKLRPWQAARYMCPTNLQHYVT